MATRIPTQKEVRRLFEYDADQGVLIWKSRPPSSFKEKSVSAKVIAGAWNKRHAGNVAGSLNKLGYRYIIINNVGFLAHKLIWLYVHGEWPDEIDHLRGTVDGDRLDNLRAASRTENQRNTPIRADNSSGVVGVISDDRGMWKAQIGVGRRCIFLGRFQFKEDAVAARKEAERLYGFHQNHGRMA